MISRKSLRSANPFEPRYTNKADLGKLRNALLTVGRIHLSLPVSYESQNRYRETLRTNQVHCTTNQAESAFGMIVDPMYAKAGGNAAHNPYGTSHSLHQEGITTYHP